MFLTNAQSSFASAGVLRPLLGVLLEVCTRRGLGPIKVSAPKAVQGFETETNFKLLDGMEVNYVSLTNGH